MARDETLPTLSGKEMAVLDLLLANGQMYAAQMVAGSKGRLGRGTVYVTLDRMEDKGYVESWEDEPHPAAIGLPRRLYRVTGFGQRVFDAWELARAALAEAMGT